MWSFGFSFGHPCLIAYGRLYGSCMCSCALFVFPTITNLHSPRKMCITSALIGIDFDILLVLHNIFFICLLRPLSIKALPPKGHNAEVNAKNIAYCNLYCIKSWNSLPALWFIPLFLLDFND